MTGLVLLNFLLFFLFFFFVLNRSFAKQLSDDNSLMTFTLRAKGIGDAGMLGIGFGGLIMYDAQV